jgi:broad specificity phosphatase PhoE
LAERGSAAVRSLGFLARLGHAARGLVFLAMGVLAARAVLFARTVAAGAREALVALMREPHGVVIIAVIAGGLFAEALFRAIEGFDRRRSLLFRLKHWGRAAGAAIFGITAWRVERQIRTGGDGVRHAVQWILRQAWGPRALMLAGAVVGVAASVEVFQGATGRFREGFRRKSMSRFEETWAGRVTRVGLVAHGAILGVIAVYLVRAGLETRARDVIDSGTALRRIASLPLGSGLLAAIAVGLVAYGLSQWVLALYRKS